MKSGAKIVIGVFALLLFFISPKIDASNELPDIRDNPSFDGVLGDFFELNFGEHAGSLDLSRLFFIGVRKYHRIINLTKERATESSSVELETNRSDAGFQVTRSLVLNLGFGPNWLFMPGQFISPGVGVMPLVGSRAYVKQTVATLEEAKTVSVFRMPENLNQISSWHDSDRVLYMGVGGVVFSAGVGLQGIIGAGARLFVDGNWIFSLQKVDKGFSRACVTRGKATSVAATVGTAISFVEASHIRAYDRTFCFKLESALPEANTAYQLLFKGDIDSVQKLVAANTPGIRLEVTEEEHSAGSFRNWFLGLPELIFAFKMFGTLSTIADQEIQGEWSIDKFVGSYLSESARGGFFINDKSVQNDFSVALQKKINSKGDTKTSLVSQFRWGYQQERAKKRSFRKALDRLIAHTGFRDVVDAELPDLPLGYFEARLTVDFSAKGMESLCSLDLQKLDQFAISRFKSYFEKDSDPDLVCKGLFFCEFLQRKRTQKALRLYHDAISSACAANTGTEYVREMSRLGKAMMATQFAFRALLDVMPKGAVHVGYKISGEDISQRSREGNY